MKRFLFVAILVSIFAIDDVSAQVISYSQTTVTKIEKERKPVELRQFAGAEVGLMLNDPYAKMSLNAYYELGAMFNKSIFVGGGLGIGNTFNNDDYIQNPIFDGSGWETTSKGFSGKFYANAKFYLTKTKLRPYFDVSVGGMFNKTIEYYEEFDSRVSDEFDFFVNPKLGLDYHIERNVESVFLNIGYNICGLIWGMWPETGAVTIKLGISF